MLCITTHSFAQTKIIQYEYWFNDDIVNSTSVNVAPTEELNLNTNVNVGDLSTGLHKFHIRFKDNNGIWSSPLSQYVYRNVVYSPLQTQIVQYEYWFNDDYESAIRKTIEPTEMFDLAMRIDIDESLSGTRTFHIRFMDNQGNWSSTSSSVFTIRAKAGFTHIVGLSEVTFTNISKYADTYEWDFGDGNTSNQVNPIHTYAEPGMYEVKLTAYDNIHSDSIKHYVEIEGIKRIGNSRGGNNGFSSFDIHGGGLTENTVVKLVRDGEIISTHSVYKREPGVICATFDLTSKSIGVYDIVVTIDGKDYTVTDGFTIEEANYPQAFAQIEGNNVFIAGRWQTYTVNYGNSGNTDIYGLPINLIFSNNSDCEFAFDLLDTNGEKSADYVVLTSITSELFGGRKITDVYESITNPSDIISLSTTAFDGKMYSVFIPHIPANTSGSFSFRMKVNTSQATKMYVNTGEILNDIYFNTQEENKEDNELFGYWLTKTFDIKKEMLSAIIRNEINKSFTNQKTSSQKQFVNFVTLINNSGCFSSMNNLRSSGSPLGGTTTNCDFSARIAEIDKQLQPNDCGSTYSSWVVPDLAFRDACTRHDIGYATCNTDEAHKSNVDNQFLFDMVRACQEWSSVEHLKLNCITLARQYYAAVVGLGNGAFNDAQRLACEKDNLVKEQTLGCPVSTEITPQKSYDPNEILGVSGYGDENYIAQRSSLNYTVYFENDAEKATAPAQEILVSNMVDLSKYNADDFNFGTFTFRDVTIEATPGVTEFSHDVDMRPKGEDIIVRIQATFDKTTGEVRCYMIALDPVTMDLTENPNLGILYPNTAPPIGDGNFTYRIGLRQDLAHGTTISNKADIIFDLNEPIETNVFVNTLDLSKPESDIWGVIDSEDKTKINLSWSGNDTGSGVASYTVYASVNDGEFYPWLSNTTELSGVFAGELNSTYKFYVQAADNVGNVENSKAEPEFTTTLQPTGIKTVTDDGKIKLYPNPFAEELTIEATENNSSMNFEIINTAGQVVASGTVLNKTVVPTEHFLPGVYIVKLSGKNIGEFKKVIKK
jgi:PKD repeat protein